MSDNTDSATASAANKTQILKENGSVELETLEKHQRLTGSRK